MVRPDDLNANRSCGYRATFFVRRSSTRLGAPNPRPSAAGLRDRVPAAWAYALAFVSLTVGADVHVHGSAGLSYGRKWTPRMHEVCGCSCRCQ